MECFATVFAADADDEVDTGFLEINMLPKRKRLSRQCYLQIKSKS